MAVNMGLWSSKSVDGYLHAVSKVLDLASLAIGREVGDSCVVRTGAVSTYAGRSLTKS